MKKKILPYLFTHTHDIDHGCISIFIRLQQPFSYSLKYWKLTAPNDVHFIGFDNYINILKSDVLLVQPPEYGVPSRTDFVWNNHSRGAALSVF